MLYCCWCFRFSTIVSVFSIHSSLFVCSSSVTGSGALQCSGFALVCPSAVACLLLLHCRAVSAAATLLGPRLRSLLGAQ